MSKRLDVLLAIKALVKWALPLADVVGLDGEDATPDRITSNGRVVIRAGDPGTPEMTFSPLTYHYDHEVPIEIAALPTMTMTAEQVIDQMAAAIGDAIEVNRFLSGLADWSEAQGLATDYMNVEGSVIARVADLAIVASYQTSNPLN